jgi:formylglycine-generating enzyme required for sulfatase activity
MDVVEVTAGAYLDCTQRGACKQAESTVKWGSIPDDVKEHDSVACTAYQTSEGALPMNCISWTDADAFCQAAGKRLPTEAEWEYAAGGGAEHRRFPWGPAPPSAALLNSCDRSCVASPNHLPPGQKPIFDEDDHFPQLAPGGRFPAGDSKFGVHDMAGNVWEWTSSPYCTYPEHACASQHRVFRGGGWGGAMLSNVRTSARMWSHPSHRYNDVGFRCVKDR